MLSVAPSLHGDKEALFQYLRKVTTTLELRRRTARKTRMLSRIMHIVKAPYINTYFKKKKKKYPT